VGNSTDCGPVCRALTLQSPCHGPLPHPRSVRPRHLRVIDITGARWPCLFCSAINSCNALDVFAVLCYLCSQLFRDVEVSRTDRPRDRNFGPSFERLFSVSVSDSIPNVWTRSRGHNFRLEFDLEATVSVISAGVELKYWSWSRFRPQGFGLASSFRSDLKVLIVVSLSNVCFRLASLFASQSLRCEDDHRPHRLQFRSHNHAIFVFFAAEMCVKVLAMGLQ